MNGNQPGVDAMAGVTWSQEMPFGCYANGTTRRPA